MGEFDNDQDEELGVDKDQDKDPSRQAGRQRQRFKIDKVNGEVLEVVLLYDPNHPYLSAIRDRYFIEDPNIVTPFLYGNGSGA